VSDPVLSGQTHLTGRIRLRYVGVHPRTVGPRRRPAWPRRPRARGEAGWAELRIHPKSRIQIRKHYSFSKLFYKLPYRILFLYENQGVTMGRGAAWLTTARSWRSCVACNRCRNRGVMALMSGPRHSNRQRI
jgi:hypothetical protein